MNRAGQAAAACAMHVEERDAIAFAECRACDVRQWTRILSSVPVVTWPG
jgi:hypothetical protein